MGHPPRIPIWLRWEQRVIYFVTICVANRKPVLANDTAFSAFNAAVAKLQEWTVLAAILMPDHLHAIVSPKDREIHAIVSPKDREIKVEIFRGH